VTVNVGGVDHPVTLNDQQMNDWQAAKQNYDERMAWHQSRFGGGKDPQQLAANQKAEGMRYAAEKRQITGQLTGKEAAAKAAREKTNYSGKVVQFRGQKASVVGNSFGKIRLKLADGTVVSADPEDIQ